MNIKGFTLFTALAGLVVIGIGVLITQHMSNSEDNYKNIILALNEQQEMDSTKDLIRLDALSTFDILYRSHLKTFFTSNCTYNDNVISCDGEQPNLLTFYENKKIKHWKEIYTNYINELFFYNSGNQIINMFAEYMSNKIIGQITNYRGIFKSVYYFKVYDYSLLNSQNSIDPTDISTPLNLSATYTNKAFSEASIINNERRDNFITLMDCSPDKCDNGTFYTNLDLSLTDPNNYLLIPRIFIFNTINKDAMDDAILPRNTLSFYMPLRVFGAMHLFYELAAKKINISDYKEKEYGHEMSPDNCNGFNGFEIQKLDKISDYNSDFNSESFTGEENNFDYNLTFNAILQPYKTISISFSNDSNSNSYTFTKEKITLLNLNIIITDNDIINNFGHQPINYLFTTPISINNPLSNEEINCICDLVENTLSNCTKQ